MIELLDAGHLEDPLCGGALDLNSFVVTAPVPEIASAPDPVRYQSLTAHEDGHWIRWLGTTTGLLLSAMRYAAHRIVRDALSSLSSQQRSTVLDARKAGSPIFNLHRPPPVRDLQLPWQVWADLHYSYSALYDSERLTNMRWDIGEALSSALTDSLYWLMPLHGRRRLNSAYSGLHGETVFVRASGIGLSSRGLYESIALADEFLSWGLDGPPRGDGAPSAIRQEYVSRYRGVLGTSYGTAHAVFAAARGGMSLDPVAEAITVACLADLALNPPLPPYVRCAPDDELHWNDIYPPVRFVRACRAASRMQAITGDMSDSDLKSYLGEVAAGADLPDPFLYDMEWLNLHDPSLSGPFGFRSTTVGGSDHDEVEGDYIALLDYAARRLWALRIAEPGLVLFHGQRFLPSQRLRKASLLIGGQGAGWYTAPFEAEPSGSVGHSSDLQSGVARQYMNSLCFYLSFHELASGLGPFPMRRFPKIPTLEGDWDGIRRSVNSIMATEVW